MSDRNVFQPGDALRQTLSELSDQSELLRSRMNWPSSVQSGVRAVGAGATEYAKFIWLADARQYKKLSTMELDPGRWILLATTSWRVAAENGTYRVGGGLRVSALGQNRDAEATQDAPTGGVDLRYTSRVAFEFVGTERFTATLSQWGGGLWTTPPSYFGRFFEATSISFVAFPG